MPRKRGIFFFEDYMSPSFLVNYVTNQIWCTPGQDHQAIIELALITSPQGVWNKAPVLWRNITLPVQGVPFYVFQIGQLNPTLMGLFDTQTQWVRMDTACNQQKMICNIYDAAGVQLPRFQAWFMVTQDNNLIVAIQQPSRIAIDLGSNSIYLRVYSNAFYQSIRSTAGNQDNYINVQGSIPTTTNEILAIQNAFTASQALPGQTYGFVNGYLVSSIDLNSVTPGDNVEFIYDSSVYAVYQFPVSGLQSFTSTLDQLQKYLIHYAGAGDGTIDYNDDIDFWLVKPNGSRYSGIYYHRNQANAVRQVTHKDYSVSVPNVVLLANLQSWTDPTQLTIIMHVRKAGWNRTLTFENNRIEELYKMSDADIVGAMVGLNSTVPNWRAEVLEASPYTQIMRSNLRDITESMAEQALGYNACSVLLGMTPQLTAPVNGLPTISNIAAGLQGVATAYEYDSNGVLLGFYPKAVGASYSSTNSSCALVELITGVGGAAPDEVYGAQIQSLDPTLDYNFYTCPILNGQPTNVWTDVTNSQGKFVIANNQITWALDPTQFYTMSRSNKNFLAYTLSIPFTSGVLSFSLTQNMTRNNVTSNYVMQVPMGELDLWLNGYALVPGIDYIMDFPLVVILNKNFLVNQATAPQNITIRFTGLANPDQTMETIGDTGYIADGVLSNNNRFDIRDDKVLRITVGGKTYDRSQLVFSEGDNTVRTNSPINGLPYSIRDIVVPTRSVTDLSTMAFRAQSLAIDAAVENYLSAKIAEPDYTALSAIPALYPLYSPFCSAIINDLATGVLNNPKLKEFYNNDDVVAMCQPYLKWLAFDPTQTATATDPNYTVIQPHQLTTSVNLNIYAVKFLQRAVGLYMNGKVDLSVFINLTQITA